MGTGIADVVVLAIDDDGKFYRRAETDSVAEDSRAITRLQYSTPCVVQKGLVELDKTTYEHKKNSDRRRQCARPSNSLQLVGPGLRGAGGRGWRAGRQCRPQPATGLVILNTSFPPDVANGGGAFEDGFHVIKWLAHLKETEATRFLLITDENAETLQDKAKATGAKGLCQKPINPETLLKVVQKILGVAPPQPE